MNHEEDRMQAECFQWLWNNYPETRYSFFHVPNESIGGARYGVIQKAKGVVPGVSDNFWFWKKCVYIFEFKVDGGSLSDNQKLFISKMKENGFDVEVIWSTEEFKKRVIEILNNSILTGLKRQAGQSKTCTDEQ